MNPVVIIPAFNPPKSFKVLIESILKIRSIPIIVIDDGSNQKIDIKHDSLTLLYNINNKGKGYSLKKAFHYAYKKNFTHAVTLDADFQHDPKLLNNFLEINEDATIVLGKRCFNKDMPLIRKFSNVTTSFILSCICRRRIYDSQCGYRRYKLCQTCSENYTENGFNFESEVLIRLIGKNNCSLHHVKIPTIYETEVSTINNILDTFKFVRLILREIFTY